MNSIFTRTSIRQFESKAVEPEKLEKILRAAMQAPTAGNQQAWEFYVVSNKEVLEKLSKSHPYAGPAANAPIAIVVVYKDGGRFPELNDVDAAIATENIWLEATELGLGAVMLAVAPFEERMKNVDDILDLPQNVHAFAIIPIGYPKKVNPQQDRYDKNKIHYIQ